MPASDRLPGGNGFSWGRGPGPRFGHRFLRTLPLASRPMKLRGLVLGTALSIGAAEAVAAPVPWSHNPPGGLQPAQVPQFVAVTFDDGYGLEDGGTGGVNDIIAFMSARKNP